MSEQYRRTRCTCWLVTQSNLERFWKCSITSTSGVEYFIYVIEDSSQYLRYGCWQMLGLVRFKERVTGATVKKLFGGAITCTMEPLDDYDLCTVNLARDRIRFNKYMVTEPYEYGIPWDIPYCSNPKCDCSRLQPTITAYEMDLDLNEGVPDPPGIITNVLNPVIQINPREKVTSGFSAMESYMARFPRNLNKSPSS